MRFTGQVRIPEIDHPGIPASVVLEETQIEILLDEESLGRWSLNDVHARRLVSSAFQLVLDGEELTFIADEPIDFAYRGVDHMAETWARIKAMRAIPRSMAVKKSRVGTKPSRIGELRQAMEANLLAESRARKAAKPGVLPPASTRRSAEEAEPAAAEAPRVVPRPTAAPTEGDALAEEKARLEVERRRLEEERARLEELRREAEERDARRIEAFRLEMARLEAERSEHERVEAERARRFQEEMSQLQGERQRLQELESKLTVRAGEDAAREVAVRAELERLEAARMEMERAEAERVAAAQREMAEVEAKRQELERLEELRQQMEEREAELAVQSESDAEDSAAEDAVTEVEVGDSAAEDAVAEVEVEAEAEPVADGMLVDLDELHEDEKEPAMAAAGARERSGLMGAVRSAFTRGSRNHVHDFMPAPGGMGISRSICRECGYVSIASD